MIGEMLIETFYGILRLAFGSLELITLPSHFISSLATITAYGCWVVGVDVMALFTASVLFWWGLNMSVGLALWLWRLLPLT